MSASWFVVVVVGGLSCDLSLQPDADGSSPMTTTTTRLLWFSAVFVDGDAYSQDHQSSASFLVESKRVLKKTHTERKGVDCGTIPWARETVLE